MSLPSVFRSHMRWSFFVLFLVIFCSAVDATSPCVEEVGVLDVCEVGVECGSDLGFTGHGCVTGVPCALLDVWAGVGAFSEALLAQPSVAVRQHALIERWEAATQVLRDAYPCARFSYDFYQRVWESWQFDWPLLVFGGPSCAPFSKAGKRKRQYDPRSAQSLDTAWMAVALGALVIVLENVWTFVEEDGSHGEFSEVCCFLEGKGYSTVGVFRLVHWKVGGCSSRDRVFLIWERCEMAAVLPPPVNIERTLSVDIPSALSSVLDDPAVASKLALPWEFTRCEGHRVEGSPWRVGFVSIVNHHSDWRLGEGLDLLGDGRVWRVIQVSDSALRLLMDFRLNPEFMWVRKSALEFSWKRPVKWPVFALSGAVSALKHTSFAPGDLYLDERLSCNCVRALSPEEKWRIMGLSNSKLDFLCSMGMRDEVSGLAGNSIPSKMTSRVAALVASRVAAFMQAQKAAEEHGWLLYSKAPKLLCSPLSAVMLVLVRVATSEVAASRTGLPAAVGEFSQAQAVQLAGRWASQLAHRPARELIESSIVLERGQPGCKVRAVVICVESLPSDCELQLVPLKALGDSFAAVLAAEALIQLQRMAGMVLSSDAPTSWLTGRVVGAAAWTPTSKDEQRAKGASTEFEAALERHSTNQSKLKALLQSSGEPFLQEWAARIGDCDLSELPATLRQTVSPQNWSSLLFQDPHQPIETSWAPLPSPVEAWERPAPLRWLSAVRPQYRQEAKRRVDSFQKKLSRWFNDEGSERPSSAVIPGKWLEHWVFEVPHEFHSKPGWAVPVPVHQPSPSHLDLDFVQQCGEDYPDQELISFVVLGVRYKADVPVQVVLQPHSNSFRPVAEKFKVVAADQIAKGWTVAAPSLPMIPMLFHAWGSVARKFEPDRPRMTTDGGSPRVVIWDDDGVRVIPLNEAIALLSWPKEVKPRPLMMMISLAILLEAADLLGETIFVFTDDFKSFFNQLRLAPQEYAKTGVMHPPPVPGGDANFAFDTVLGFGIKTASNVAQRFADFIVNCFRKAMVPVVERAAARLSATSDRFSQWWAHRQSLGADQASLYSVLMYTDDPCFVCLGADMTFEALKCWKWLTGALKATMAIPEKRTIGMSTRWIGVQFFTALGVCSIPLQKLVRALQLIQVALDNQATFDIYRGLVGLLEHFKDVLYLRGDSMYGLYEPMRSCWEPAAMLSLPPLAALQLEKWRDRLMSHSGASVASTEAYITGQKMPRLSAAVRDQRTLSIFSDAAKEGTTAPGLGGWMSGFYWRLALTPEWLELSIPILEAVAAVVSVVVVAQLFKGVSELGERCRVELHVDAQATAQMLIKGRAKAPMMMAVHTAALAIPEFESMLEHLTVKHVFGRGNPASDAASRGHFHVLRAIAHNLGVRLVEVRVPSVAAELLDSCLKLMRREQSLQQHVLAWGSRGERVGEASHPGPQTFVPHKLVSSTPYKRGQDPFERPATADQLIGATFVPHSKRQRVSAGSTWGTGGTHRAQGTHPPESGRAWNFLNTASDLTKTLWADTSEFAICRGNWGQLQTACEVALKVADSAFSLNTAKQDESHWKAWESYCMVMGALPRRPPVDPLTDRPAYLRELVLLVNALTYFMKTRKPRSSRDSVIKPQSAMNILLGVNRVLRRNYSSLVPLKVLTLPLRGLMRDFIKKFGPKSLIPRRRSPYTNGMILTLVTLPDGLILDSVGALDWSSTVGRSLKAALLVSVSTGLRKAELFETNEETCFLDWSLVASIIDGVAVVHPSRGQLEALNSKDFLVLTPPPSKADQFNTVWGSSPMYIPFRDNVRNAAKAMAELVMHRGREHCKRGPVFVDNAGQALKAPAMANALRSMLASFLPAESVGNYSWHSGRVYLATALHASGCKPALIQSMLRWQTEESLRLYALLSRHKAASLLDSAAVANVAAIRSSELPIYEQFDLFVALNDAVESMGHGE